VRLIVLALSLVCASACGQDGSQARAQPEQRKQEPRKVELVRVAPHSMAREVIVQGVLAPDEEVVVSTRVAGYLQSLNVDLGSAVRKDQVIAQIDPRDLRLMVEQARAALAQARAALGLDPDGSTSEFDLDQTSSVREAKATLDEAQANSERAKTLRDRKLIAPAEFDATNTAELRAAAALEAAREDMRTRRAMLAQRASELALAQKQLADTTLRSPLEGVVSARTASVGEFLQAASPVVTVVRVNPLRLRVEVPEREAQAVQVDQRVEIFVGSDTAMYEGKISRVSPAISQETRTLSVEATVENRAGLRAGSFARAKIVVANADVNALPDEAIVRFAGIEKVLTVEDGKVVEKPVRTGRHHEGFVEILSGVDADEPVVRAPGTLQQGDPVIVAP
jgi:RND family efflux transporter MFP subunit